MGDVRHIITAPSAGKHIDPHTYGIQGCTKAVEFDRVLTAEEIEALYQHRHGEHEEAT